jgi:hypothetical protein
MLAVADEHVDVLHLDQDFVLEDLPLALALRLAGLVVGRAEADVSLHPFLDVQLDAHGGSSG